MATGKTLFWKWMEFHFRQTPQVRIRFYGRLAQELIYSTKSHGPAELTEISY